MDRIERIFNALRYIEERLPQTADLEEIAGRANMSPYHFHRTFTSVIGEPVGKYCQKRRLTLAAKSLLESDNKIFSIALSHGYESQGTFSRAFKEMFGVSPKEFRKSVTSIPTLSTDPAIKNEKIKIEPQIVKKGGFKIIGFLKMSLIKNTPCNNLLKEFSQCSTADDFVAESNEVYGLNYYLKKYDSAGETPIIQFVGFEAKDYHQVTKGMFSKEVPKQTYAIFSYNESQVSAKQVYDYIYDCWFPNSGYLPAAPFEDHHTIKKINSDYEIQIFCPVKKNETS